MFGWPPVEGGNEISHEKWMKYLRDLQTRTNYLAVAFPGFHDSYPKSYGTIDAQKGRTLEETFDLAQKGTSPIIQVVTWNDYGEGTVIQPTRKMSYRYLEHIQKSATSRIGYTPDDMRLPVRLYEARKKYAKDPSLSNRLELVSQLLFAGKCQAAREVLESLGKRSMVTNLCYRASSDDAYQMERCKVDVSSPIGATNLPVLIFFHGGGLTSNTLNFMSFLQRTMGQSPLALMRSSENLWRARAFRFTSGPVGTCVSRIGWSFLDGPCRVLLNGYR